MEFAEWYESVFVIGDRSNVGKFHNGNCRVFDKNGRCWIVEEEFYKTSTLPEDPRKWDQVYKRKLLYIQNRINPLFFFFNKIIIARYDPSK